MVRQRIFEIIQPAEKNDKTSKIFDNVILSLIIINIVSVVLESYDQISFEYKHILEKVELISIIIFSIEFLLRIFTSDLLFHEKNKIKSIWYFAKTPMAIIDLFAILPFYLPMLLPIDLRILRILRLVRVLRIFKLNRYTKSLSLIHKVLKNKKEELQISLFVVFILLLLSSSMIYFTENQVQPEKFPNIIQSLWWSIVTLTTVGYGDVVPITSIGKILGGFISLLGIGLVALPTGILSSGFIEEIDNAKKDIPRIKRRKKTKKGIRKLLKIKAYTNN